MNIDDKILDGILKIANDPNLIKRLEPNIMQPFKVEKWQVVRIMEAVNLLQKEWLRNKNGKD
jgi:hypothetical protein